MNSPFVMFTDSPDGGLFPSVSPCICFNFVYFTVGSSSVGVDCSAMEVVPQVVEIPVLPVCQWFHGS